MKKRLIATAAAALALSSCAYLEEIISTDTGKPDGSTKDTCVTSTVVITGNEKVRETMIASSIVGPSPYFQRENLNYGGFEWMSVGYYDPMTHFRSLIGFDLTEKEAASIKKATLELTTRDWTFKHRQGPVTIELYPMTSGWSEGNGGTGSDAYNTAKYLGPTNSKSVNGATAMESQFGTEWNMQFCGIGLDCGAKPIASAVHSASEGSVVWSFDITSTATREQLSKGFLIVLKEGAGSTADYYFDYPNFNTTESGAEVAPKLILVK